MWLAGSVSHRRVHALGEIGEMIKQRSPIQGTEFRGKPTRRRRRTLATAPR